MTNAHVRVGTKKKTKYGYTYPYILYSNRKAALSFFSSLFHFLFSHHIRRLARARTRYFAIIIRSLVSHMRPARMRIESSAPVEKASFNRSRDFSAVLRREFFRGQRPSNREPKPVSSRIITRRNPRRINCEVSATGRKANREQKRNGGNKRQHRSWILIPGIPSI